MPFRHEQLGLLPSSQVSRGVSHTYPFTHTPRGARPLHASASSRLCSCSKHRLHARFCLSSFVMVSLPRPPCLRLTAPGAVVGIAPPRVVPPTMGAASACMVAGACCIVGGVTGATY